MQRLWYSEEGKEPQLVELHDVDAVHALAVDPDHWATNGPQPIATAPIEPEAEQATVEPLPFPDKIHGGEA